MRQDFHPLDWASHLRQSLAIDPVPTVLVLLVVASHYHACCSSGGVAESASVFGAAAIQNETSVLGFVFASLSSATRIARSLNASEWMQHLLLYHPRHEGAPCIDTPFKAMRRAKQQRHDDSPGETEPRSSVESEEYSFRDDNNVGEEPASPVSFSDGILRVSMTDPFTIAYNTWTYIANGGAEEDGEIVIEQIQQEQPPVLPVTSDSSKREDCTNKAQTASASSAHSVVVEEDMWAAVFALHAIGMGGVVFALLPSLFVQGHLLACNAGMVQQQSCAIASAWPLLNSSALVFCLSLLSCCAIHYVLEMRALALCTAMHLVARSMAAYMDVCVGCPLPPVYMPSTAATGMALCMGVLLMCISQMHPSGEGRWDTGSFYMNHAWACGVSVLVIRHTVFRSVAWLVGCAQAEFLREMVVGAASAGGCNGWKAKKGD